MELKVLSDDFDERRQQLLMALVKEAFSPSDFANVILCYNALNETMEASGTELLDRGLSWAECQSVMLKCINIYRKMVEAVTPEEGDMLEKRYKENK